MPTYFNYVEREADSYVNWADVGRDMSNTIDDIQRVREEKKGLIEKTYREDLKFIQDNPSGEHETLRAWSLGVAQSSAEMMRLQNTLLKQGKLNLPNYLSFRQNITDSVEKIYTVNSQLQEAFKEVNDRTKAEGNQQLERETKVLLEKYGKLEDTEAYINPLNGTIYLGLTEIVEGEDGKSVRRLKKGEGTYLSPEQLQAAAMQKFDNYDPEPKLIEWSKTLGTVKESLRQKGSADFAGMITSVEDIKGDRWRKIAEENNLSEAQIKDIEKFISDFRASEDNFLNGILQIPTNASAILTEKMGINPKTGNPYEIVFNESEQKSSDQLYVEKTKEGEFIPRFDTKYGKEQKDDLREYLRSQLTPKYNRIVEQQTYTEVGMQKQQPPRFDEGAAEYGRAIQSDTDLLTALGDLYFGDDKKRKSALVSVNQYKDVNKVYFDKTGELVVAMDNGDVWRSPFGKPKKDAQGNVIGFEQGSGMGAKDAIGSIAVGITGGRISRERALREVPDRELNYNPMFEEIAVEQDPLDIYRSSYSGKLNQKYNTETGAVDNETGTSPFQMYQKDAAATLSKALSGTGVTVKATGTGGYIGTNHITISHPNAKDPISFYVYESASNAATNQQNLDTWLQGIFANLDEKEKERYSKTMNAGGGSKFKGQ